jgi:hypothetical protein
MSTRPSRACMHHSLSTKWHHQHSTAIASALVAPRHAARLLAQYDMTRHLHTQQPTHSIRLHSAAHHDTARSLYITHRLPPPSALSCATAHSTPPHPIPSHTFCHPNTKQQQCRSALLTIYHTISDLPVSIPIFAPTPNEKEEKEEKRKKKCPLASPLTRYPTS